MTRSLSRALKSIGSLIPKPVQIQTVVPIQRRRKTICDTRSLRVPMPIFKRRHTMVEATSSTQKKVTRSKIWCICRQPEFGEMIACDGPNCTIQWFHMSCIKMQAAPAGQWFCGNCRMLLQH